MTDSRLAGAEREATTTGRTPAVYDTRRTETRRAFKTSEFWVFVAAAAAVLVTTYTDNDDTLTEWRGWLLFCAVAVAYIVSRGIAKAGSTDPRIERIELD
ncbi:MAG TPA: hypothetical protein VFO65_13655 [Acidimicrobiales bacterium]|nr:hypothetical protein [Acidimicrobiales bacterium]